MIYHQNQPFMGFLYTILGIHRHILGDDDDAWDVQSPKRIWHRSFFLFHETILSYGGQDP